MAKEPIHTSRAPAAIGPYSQAIRAGNTVYLSGQIPLESDDDGARQGRHSRRDPRRCSTISPPSPRRPAARSTNAVRLTVYLTDLAHFPIVNEIMAEYCKEPYPARAAIGVAQLPRGAAVEVDGILVL